MSRLVKLTKEEVLYLDPVMGQLSDGIWENSPRMEVYWLCNSLTSEGIEMEPRTVYSPHRRTLTNPLYDKSDKEVKDWFANKLKAVVKQYLEDSWDSWGTGEWSRLNNEEVDYLDAGQTVAGAYKVYDSLKGRPDSSGKVVRVKEEKMARELMRGDIIGKDKVVNVIQPHSRKDEIVTIVLDSDEVLRINQHQTVEIIKYETIQ